jgi:hypothetical protein
MRTQNLSRHLPPEAFHDTDEMPVQRTMRGLKFETWRAKIGAMIASENHAKDFDELNLRLKNLTPGTTTVVQVLQDLSIMYANDDFIGERLMPVVTIPTSKGLSVEYWKYDKRNKFRVPTTKIGTSGQVHSVSENVSMASVSLTKEAQNEFVDAWNQEMFDSIVQDLIDPTMNVADALALKREVDIATVLCTYTNYGSNYTAVSAADRWDSSGGGDPGGLIDTCRRSIWRGTGQTRLVVFASWDVHRVLKRHPAILDTFKYQGGKPMQATPAMLAEYFEVDEYLVGLGKYDSVNEGQTATYSSIWSDVFGMVRVAVSPGRRSAFFGATFSQPPTQSTWFEQGRGGKGGYWTQIAYADEYPVICADCGFLITTPIG